MIKVVGEKVVNKNSAIVKGIKLKMLKGLDLNELPHEYHKEQPYCYFRNECVVIRTSDIYREYSVGDVLSQGEWQSLIAALHQCGNRLTKINEKIKQETEGWSGTIEIEI